MKNSKGANRIVIETTRLVLRTWDSSDVDAYYRIMSDPLVLKYLPLDSVTRQYIEEKIAARMEQHKEHGFCLWALIHKDSGELIGHCGLQYIPGTEEREVEIGYALSQRYWGMGLATEAARACLEYGFKTLKLKKIVGLAMTDNRSSRNILEKIGLRFRGISDKYYNITSAVYDSSTACVPSAVKDTQDQE